MKDFIKGEIKTLINVSLAEAEAKHKPMNGKHEAYAILKEEIEEAQEEMQKIKNKLDDFWRLVRIDHSSNGYIFDNARKMKELAELAIYELLQVACVSSRIIKDLGLQEREKYGSERKG